MVRSIMKSALQIAVLAWIVAVATLPIDAFADSKIPNYAPREIKLDIDHDGKLDRAMLVEDAAHGYADLYIYLGVGAGKIDLTSKPAILREKFTTARILALESNNEGSLIIKSGCGGCSNDYATTLTIVYRGGEFLVGGVTYDWDTRNGIGSCDINFLTGKALMSRAQGKTKPIRGRFTPVKLADWSDAKRPKACR